MSRSVLEDAFAHVWATLRLIDACLALTPEQLGTEVPGTYGSILERDARCRKCLVPTLLPATATEFHCPSCGKRNRINPGQLEGPALMAFRF